MDKGRQRAVKSNPNNFERRVGGISRVFQEVTERRRVSQQQVTKPFKEAALAMVQKMQAANAAVQGVTRSPAKAGSRAATAAAVATAAAATTTATAAAATAEPAEPPPPTTEGAGSSNDSAEASAGSADAAEAGSSAAAAAPATAPATASAAPTAAGAAGGAGCAKGGKLEFFYMCPETLWSNIEASHAVFQIDPGKCTRCQQELVGWRYCNECKSLHAGILLENGTNCCGKKSLRVECERAVRNLGMDRADPRRAALVAELVKERDEKVAKYKADNARWLWRHNASPNARGTLLVGHSAPEVASRKRKKAAAEAAPKKAKTKPSL